jgi:hypothetical protein
LRGEIAKRKGLSESGKPESEAYFDEGTIGFDGELFTILQAEFD